MTQRILRALLAGSLVTLCSCAARSPATSWGWSSWYLRGGAFGDTLMFEGQRSTCMSQMGIKDPKTILPDSPEEIGFLECMNAAGWCTQVWQCNKPGGG